MIVNFAGAIIGSIDDCTPFLVLVLEACHCMVHQMQLSYVLYFYHIFNDCSWILHPVMIEQVKELDVEQVMVCSCEKPIQVEKLFQHCVPWFTAPCIMCGQD